jgi:hypothetical protein
MLEELIEDTRTVEVAGEEDETEQVTIGELASEALDMIAGPPEDEEQDNGKPNTPRRGGAG